MCSLRGNKKVNAKFRIMCIAMNILKLYKKLDSKVAAWNKSQST